MTAAANFQRPPSAFLGGKEWGLRDHLLVFAHQIYLDTKCPRCGQSVYVCRNDKNNGIFQAESTACYAQAAIDERTAQQGYKPDPGEMLYALPIDDDLVSRSGLVFQSEKNSLQVPD